MTFSQTPTIEIKSDNPHNDSHDSNDTNKNRSKTTKIMSQSQEKQDSQSENESNEESIAPINIEQILEKGLQSKMEMIENYIDTSGPQLVCCDTDETREKLLDYLEKYSLGFLKFQKMIANKEINDSTLAKQMGPPWNEMPDVLLKCDALSVCKIIPFICYFFTLCTCECMYVNILKIALFSVWKVWQIYVGISGCIYSYNPSAS